MQNIEGAIRDCWDHYAFEDALYLSEIYYFETASDAALHLLATSYYRSGQLTCTYLLLKCYGVRTADTKYLFAKCCEDVDNLSEAESIINENDGILAEYSNSERSDDFASSSPFVRKLLGRIFSKTNRFSQSAEAHKRTLECNPLLFSSLTALNTLGDDSTKLDHLFDPSSKFFKNLNNCRIAADGNTTQRSTKVYCQEILKVKSFASSTVSPAFEINADSKMPPKAPRKATTRRLMNNDNSAASHIMTRQRTNPLSQNQSQITTRRSNRLFENSIKENEIDVTRTVSSGPPRSSSLSNRSMGAQNLTSSGRLRLRKLENEDTKNLNKTKRRTPLIENLGKLVNLDENEVWREEKCEKDLVVRATQNDTITDTDAFIVSFADLLKTYALIESSLSRFDFKKTLESVEKLPDKHKNSPFVLYALGKTYFELADYQKAVKYFDECRQKYEYYVKGVEYHSVALWHLQMDLQLSALSQDMVEKHPYVPETWCAAGNCFSLEKEQETAIKFFQRAIQLNPEFSYAYTLLGHEYIAMEEYEKAIQAFRSALRYQPRHYNAWYGLGLIYSKQEKQSLANTHFLRALKINPNNSVLLCSVAQQGEECREKAMQFLNDALATAPKNSLCRYYRAQLLFSDEKYDEALVEIDQLKQLAPKESRIYFLAGKIHKKLGQPHLALMNFSWGTELDPRGEQHSALLNGTERRFDEEPVTALAALEAEDAADIHIMESDESA